MKYKFMLYHSNYTWVKELSQVDVFSLYAIIFIIQFLSNTDLNFYPIQSAPISLLPIIIIIDILMLLLSLSSSLSSSLSLSLLLLLLLLLFYQ